MGSIKLMMRFARNQVLPLSELRAGNYPLFKFFTDNKEKLIEVLKTDYNVEVLDDLLTKRDYDRVRLYLKYHFDEEVNMTELRLKHKTVYNYLFELGDYQETLKKMGFQVVYKHITSRDKLVDELEELADSDKLVKLKGDTRTKVRQRAYHRGQSIEEYLSDLGFKLFLTGSLVPTVQRMKDREGKSFRDIAKELDISVATAHELYYRENEEE